MLKILKIIKGVIAKFFPDGLEPLKLHSVHDGASNMMKVSRLLKVEEPQRCLVHSLYLLLSGDGFKKFKESRNIKEGKELNICFDLPTICYFTRFIIQG